MLRLQATVNREAGYLPPRHKEVAVQFVATRLLRAAARHGEVDATRRTQRAGRQPPSAG
jgi:hypothetical protein